MPRQITLFNVFIGSPGGLEGERKRFREALQKCSALHGHRKGIAFHPVGWEDTIGGVGRPQAQINKDLRRCDFAVFILHDRWGTPTGGGQTSGTQEEFELAEQLYDAKSLLNIALFFKKVDPDRLADPGPQLSTVMEFKRSIEDSRRYLFKQYESLEQFVDALDGHLAKWMEAHEVGAVNLSTPPATAPRPLSDTSGTPSAQFWLSEVDRLSDGNDPNYAAILYCSERAAAAATSPDQLGLADLHVGISQFHLGKYGDAVDKFDGIARRFLDSNELPLLDLAAKALINKAFGLGTLGRSEEEIATFDELIARFSAQDDRSIQEFVARALLEKAVRLGMRGHIDKEIATYDDVIARFWQATEPPIREQVAMALLNKGGRLASIHRFSEAITAFDKLIQHFQISNNEAINVQIGQAYSNKARCLLLTGKQDDAINIYRNITRIFINPSHPVLRLIVQEALLATSS